MADQEFLALFGVDIDESGVSRLQQILTENQTLAKSLSDSFNAASESVKAFGTEGRSFSFRYQTVPAFRLKFKPGQSCSDFPFHDRY